MPEEEFKKHFTPKYNPWEQRVCLNPKPAEETRGGDFFQPIRAGIASICTDNIDHFTEDGIKLASGEELKADLVVTATGLVLQEEGDKGRIGCSGVTICVDGKPVNYGDLFMYKGSLFSDVPNFAFCVGYSNASWTLKADLTSKLVCNILNHMDEKRYRTVVARKGAEVQAKAMTALTSGYLLRSIHLLPKQGNRHPWNVGFDGNYFMDAPLLNWGSLEDGVLEYQKALPMGKFLASLSRDEKEQLFAN